MITHEVIRAEFYHSCKLLGINCILELRTPYGRPDIIVLNGDWTIALLIVETKTYHMNSVTNQIARYKLSGLPVFGCWSIPHAHKLANQFKRTLNTFKGRPLTEFLNDQKINRRQFIRERNKTLTEAPEPPQDPS